VKTLIAVTSYFPDAVRGCHQAIRDGWGKDVAAAGAALRFFTPYPHFADPEEYGDRFGLDSYKSSPDEEWLSMNGLYTNIAYQVQNILKWSLGRGYDFIHVCANDSFMVPSLLFSPGFEQYDWRGEWWPDIESPYYPVEIGRKFDWNWYDLPVHDLYGWISGEAGMTFSKKAAEIIVAEDLKTWIDKHDFWGFGYDSLFGQIFGPYIQSGFSIKDDTRGIWHYAHAPKETRYEGVVRWQKDMYEKMKDAQ
jgi:hypothetical protein